MTSTINKILLALHAAAFILAGPSKFCVMASPVSISTRASLGANHSLHDQSNVTHEASPPVGTGFTGRAISADLRSSNPTIVAHSSTPRSLRRRDEPWKYYNRAQENYNNLQSLSKRSADAGQNDVDFQRSCLSQASAYQSNLLRLQSSLAELGNDKGLANYDRTNDVETLLKYTVDLNKSVLDCIDVLIQNVPVLGPILGPVVYEIKCILDDLLNYVENLTDGIINALQPLLKALIGHASTMDCSSGVDIVGICV